MALACRLDNRPTFLCIDCPSDSVGIRPPPSRTAERTSSGTASRSGGVPLPFGFQIWTLAPTHLTTVGRARPRRGRFGPHP